MSPPGRPQGEDPRVPPEGTSGSRATDGDRAVAPERTVPCPVCRQPAVYAARNPYRPFCSERCRDIDLGAWASEGYRVAHQAPADNADDEPPSRH